MKHNLALYCLLIFIFIGCTNIPHSADVTGDYLGQTPPGNVPELFAPGIITHGFHEHGIAISPDGNEMFYVTTDNRYSLYIIIHTERIDNTWTEPEVAFFSGQYRDYKPSFSPDGNRLYFGSYRPLPGTNEPKDDSDIWFIEKSNTGWSEPQNLGSPVNTEFHEVNQTVAANGNIYFQFLQKRGLTGEIYMSEFINDRYSVPIRLENGINTKYNEASPYIAPDESYLMFHSNRQGTLGSMDIYISFRQDGGSWSEPVNMGEPVNSPFPDNIPYVSPDGKYFFFSSYKTLDPEIFKGKTYKELMSLYRNPQNGYMTIFWMSSDIINGLKNRR
ncbi:hypothetical protein ACFL6G_08895 [candidate division KSB1 bacterium]